MMDFSNCVKGRLDNLYVEMQELREELMGQDIRDYGGDDDDNGTDD